MSALLWILLLPQSVSGSVCPEAIERQLDSWHASSEVLKTPGGPLGGAVYRIATDELGVWITVHQTRGLDSTSVSLTSSSETVRLDFGATCVPSSVRTPSPQPPVGAFTDDDLESLLERDDRLVVYLWSPHLPLSVEGYAEIEAATAAVGVPLAAVVDASAERGFVQRVAQSEGIPEEARRPMASVELLFRDLAVHTPSILVFADGTTSAPLPGYRNRSAYARFLETTLRASEQGSNSE